MKRSLASTALILIGIIAAWGKEVQLNAEVFKSMAKMPMPPVGNTFFTEFEFKTSNNELVEALSFNATYVANPEAPEVNLMIPMDRVILTGKYFSSLRIYTGYNTMITQNNSGTYLLHMSDVNLRVKIGFGMNITGMHLSVIDDECIPTMQGMSIMLKENSDTEPRLSTNTIRELLEFSTVDEFKNMFCDAMRLIAQSGSKSMIAKAIFDRIEATLFEK